MKINFLFLLLLIGTSVFSQTKKINLKSFGEISVTKNKNVYVTDLGKFGTYNCSGSIDPLALKVAVTTEDLKKFPGANIYANIGIKEASLAFSEEGLAIEAIIDTKKSLGKVFAMYKINNPELGISVKLSKKSFELEGSLNFEEDPIIIDVIKDFSRFTLEKFSIAAKAGVGEGAEIGISIQNRWKPTKWDSDIQSVTAFSYNLINQTITASISMTDTWSNPLFLSKLLKEDAVVFSDVAASIDWTVGSPSPTGFGFSVGMAKFFDLEFATQMAITPADKQVAIYASRNELTLNDFSKILRNGFGLKVPDVFPKDIYIKNAAILFSPNGGEVGEFEIEKGFKIIGEAKFMDAVNAEIEFVANWEDGFYLYYNMEAGFKEFLEKEFKNNPKLKYISGQLLRTFEVKKVILEMSSDMSLNMQGATHCEMVLLGKTIKFDLEGNFSAQALKEKVIDEVMKLAGPEAAAVIGAVDEGVKLASKVAGTAISSSSNLVNKYAKLAVVKKDHMHNIIPQKSDEHCKKYCVPKKADQMTKELLSQSKNTIQNFHNSIIDDLIKIEGADYGTTKKMRKEYFFAEWTDINKKIDENWHKVKWDKGYVGFFLIPDNATNGGHYYRKLIDEKKKEFIKLQKKLYKNLINARISEAEITTLKDIYFIRTVDQESYINIPGYHLDAEREKGTRVSVYPKDKVEENLQGIDRFIKIIPHATDTNYVFLQPQHSDLVLDVVGGKREVGTKIHLWTKGENNSAQMFKLIEIEEKENTYYIERKDGDLVLTSNGNSKYLSMEKNTNAENQQWIFETADVSDMASIETDRAFLLENVKGGLYVDIDGKSKNKNVQLWSKHNKTDRFIQLLKSKYGGYYYIQHLHSNYVWTVKGTQKGANLQLDTKQNKGSQQFKFIFAGSPMTFKIKELSSRKFIDANAHKIKENACNIGIWDENKGDNQKWRIEPMLTKWYVPKKPVKVKVKVAGSDKTWDLGGGPEKAKQKKSILKIWKDEDAEDRFYTIKSSGNASWIWIEVGTMRIDVMGAKVKNIKTGLHTWTPHNGDSQKFAIHPTSNNTCIIVSKGWKALDVAGGKIHTDGPVIHLWNKHFGASQQFQLIDVKTGKPIDFSK